MTTSNPLGGIIGMPNPEIMAAMSAFAETIMDSKFIRPEIRGDKSTILFLLLIGQDLQLPWTTALRLIYPVVKNVKQNNNWVQVVSGVGIEGKAVAALLLSRGFKLDFTEYTDEACSLILTRPDGTVCPVERFTFKQAAEGKMTTNSAGEIKVPYNVANRANQLRWRALGRSANVYAADVLQGVYVTEELQDHETALAAGEPAGLLESGTVAEPEPKVGRKPKAEPAAEPVAEQPKKAEEAPQLPVQIQTPVSAPVAETKKQEPTPAPTPLPTPAPAPTPADPWKVQLKARVDVVKVKLAEAGLSPNKGNKSAQSIVNAFFRGWYGVATLNAMPAKDYTEESLAALELSATENMAQLSASTEEAGKLAYRLAHPGMSSPESVLNDKITKEWGWPADTVALVKKYLQDFDMQPVDFSRWIEFIHAHQLLVGDQVQWFLAAATVHKGSAATLVGLLNRKPVVDSDLNSIEKLVGYCERIAKKALNDMNKDDFLAAAEQLEQMVQKQEAEAAGTTADDSAEDDMPALFK